MTVSIQVDHLSKYYSIESLHEYSSTVGHTGAISQQRIHEKYGFAALDDISFSIQAGTAVGLVGSNGAGKSTLLRILGGIVRPSQGTVKIDGQVSALLTLAGGMNPHTSGRQNVYMHGAMLGFSKSEIDSYIDEIIEFAGLEMFIDAPMMTYSSGMRARLAFAASMYLKSNVLLIDEILAVGDKAFQEKALQATRRYFTQGKTVIIASHNTTALRGLCQELIWLENGKLQGWGETEEILPAYLDFMASPRAVPLINKRSKKVIGEIASFNALGVQRRRFPVGESIQLRITFTGMSQLHSPQMEIRLFDFVTESTLHSMISSDFIDGDNWHDSGTAMVMWEGLQLPPRQYRFEVTVYELSDTGEPVKVDSQLFSLAYYDPEAPALSVTPQCKMIITRHGS
jgi:ABC-type polysaccharide/polyol phosphate transport system ATPase subunit